jgi:hypothetical protein
MNKLAAVALTAALVAIPTLSLAHDPYPTYIPGTNNKILWPSHDKACDEAMDAEDYGKAIGKLSFEPNDPSAGVCVKAMMEYADVLSTMSHLSGISPTTVLSIGANAAMTETELAWALHAEGDDDSGRTFAKSAIGLYYTSLKDSTTMPEAVVTEYGRMFERINGIYPDLIPPELREQPGDPGTGDPDPESSPGGPGY